MLDLFSGPVGILGFILIVLVLFALFNVVQSRAKTMSKAIWAAILILFPFGGFLLWFFLGPRSARR